MTGPPRLVLNRELSWLDFDARVLALAEDAERPLLERVKFLAISSRNLDEFFQVRVARLRAQRAAGVTAPSRDGLAPAETLSRIRAKVLTFVRRQQELFAKELVPGLAERGVQIVDWAGLVPAERTVLGRVFEERLLPELKPVSVDALHSIARVANLSLHIAVAVRGAPGSHRFARVEVPAVVPRFLRLPGGGRLVPVEQVIAAHLAALFPGADVLSHDVFRVTRDADIHADGAESQDLLRSIEDRLRRRQRLNDAVRLEVERATPTELRALVQRDLALGEEDLYECASLLDLGALWALYDLERPDLKDRPRAPATQPRLSKRGRAGRSFFRVLDEGDVLVHHPYESFATSVEAFLTEAASDPDVLAIKHTLYRTSGPRNAILEALARAARAGKEVVTLIEIKARFDERPNIEWARALEQAGVRVIHGVAGLKTHAKIALVVRRTPQGVRRYCHLATGNYNPVTANLYEDVSLFSASSELSADLSDLFDRLTGEGAPRRYRRLLVAPDALRASIVALIGAEAREPDGRVVMKMNGLTDPALIAALYGASQAGVEIDLIVRGICCLRPGVPGLSDRIRVRSLVGRYLEHSRIFRFGSERRGARYFIGSADMMGRNLDRRVEAVAPVEDPQLRARLDEILALDLADDALAWELASDGTWKRVERARGLSASDRLEELARARAG